MSDACSFPKEKAPTAESDTTIESGLCVSVELKDIENDLFLSQQRLMNEVELSVIKESAVVTKTLHHSHVWAPLAAVVCNKASLLTRNKKAVYVGWDGLGYVQKESDRGKLGRIHVQQREELNELKDMRVVQKTLKEDRQELVHHAKQLFPLRDPVPPPLSPASSTAATSSNVIITSSSSSCYQSQKSVKKTKLFVSTVFKVAARRRKNVLDRLTTEQIKNIAASSKTRRFSHDPNNDRNTPEKSSSWEARHLSNSEETDHDDMTLSLPSGFLGVGTTTSSKPEVETITEEPEGSRLRTSFISVHNDSTVLATSEEIASDGTVDALESAPLLSSPPPPSSMASNDSYRLKSHSSPPLLLSVGSSTSRRVMAKRIVQTDGVQIGRTTETKEESEERTASRRPLRETEGNEEKEEEEEEEEEVKSKKTTSIHDNNKREELDLSQSQRSLIHSMMSIEDDLSPSSSHSDLHTRKFVRVSSETTALHSNTNFFRQSIASPDFSDTPIHTYFSHPLSASNHCVGHTQMNGPNLESVPETSENEEKPSGATAKTPPPSLPLDDPQFNEYCQQLDHPPTPEDYAAYKIQMVGQLIDDKYHDKLNEAISLIMIQAMKDKLIYSEFARVSRWLSLQAKYVQDQSLLVTWLGYRLYEKLPNLEKIINEYTTQAIEDVTQFGIDWIGDTPFDNPEIRMDYDYDGDIEAEQLKIHDRKNDFPLRRTISAEVLIDEEQPGEEQGSKRTEPWFPGQRSETPPLSRREYMSPNVVEVASPNEVKRMLQDNRNKPSRSRPMVISISSQSSIADSVSSSIKTIGSTISNGGGRTASLANIREGDCEERGEGGGSVFYFSSPSPPLQSKSGDSEAGENDNTKEEKNDEDSERGKEEEGEGEGEEKSRKISEQIMASGLALVAAAAALALRK